MVNKYENTPISYNFVIDASKVIPNKPKSAATEKTEGVGRQFFSRMRDFFSSNSVRIILIVNDKKYDVTITGDRSQIKVIKQMQNNETAKLALTVAKVISSTLTTLGLEKSVKNDNPPPPYPGKTSNYEEDEIPAYDTLPGTPLPSVKPEDMPE